LRARSIIPRIAGGRVESSERLGRYRWRVERTLSWLNRFRRFKVRYERRADIHQAFLSLGCALIFWRVRSNQVKEALQEAVRLTIAAVTPSDVAVWFARSGYALPDQATCTLL
jgi:hypothetical protein